MARTKTKCSCSRSAHDKSDKKAVIAAAQRQSNNFVLRNAADQALWGDKDVVLAAIASNGRNFEYATPELKADPEVVSKALSSYGQNLMHCSEKFRSDRGFVSIAVKNSGLALKWCSEDLADEEEIVRLAIEQCGAALEYASDRFKNDEEIVSAALTSVQSNQKNAHSHWIFSYASEELRRNRKMVITAIRTCGGLSLMHVPSAELLNDRDLIMEAAKTDGGSLEYASPHLKSDRDIVIKAVENNGMALEFASEELRDDREIVMMALKSCSKDRFSLVLQFASNNLKNDKELVLYAVSIAGFNLQYASPTLQGDYEVVETALRNKHFIRAHAILAHSSQEIRADRQIISSAIEGDSKTLLLASKELQMDPNIVALAWGTMNEDHDFDLWSEFNASDLRRRYIAEVLSLGTELKLCNKLNCFEVDNPHSTVQFAERWLTESLEKIWLTGEIVQIMGIPTELGSSITTFTGARRDQTIASKLVRFGSILCYTMRGMKENFQEEIWNFFIADAKEILGDDTE